MKYRITTWETGETLASAPTLREARAEARRILGVRRMTKADNTPRHAVEGWFGSKREGCLSVLVVRNRRPARDFFLTIFSRVYYVTHTLLARCRRPVVSVLGRRSSPRPPELEELEPRRDHRESSRTARTP